MKRRTVTVSLMFLLGAGWLAGQAKPAPAAKTVAPASKSAGKQAAGHSTRVVSFRRDVLPILQDRCMACHFQKDQWPGMDLSQDRAYLTLVNQKGQLSGKDVLVKPTDPASSFLMNKLSAKPRVGDRMPPYGMGLTPQEHHLVAQWIQQGARNN